MYVYTVTEKAGMPVLVFAEYDNAVQYCVDDGFRPVIGASCITTAWKNGNRSRFVRKTEVIKDSRRNRAVKLTDAEAKAIRLNRYHMA